MFKKYNPSQFQGSKTKKGYFEGWYYKLVDDTEEIAFAIIPGISLPKNDEKPHAFIMVFDARNHKMNYFKFDIDEFKASKSEFKLKIADNFFSHHQLHLNLNKDSLQIKARLEFKNIIPWPVSVFSPGVMGWYSFVPFMECYHGVLSFNHQVKGYIEINNQKKDFNKGKGYLEKDWGTSMPSSWIWMQSNHFEEENASLFGSIAKIPWLKNYFTGFIFGFLLNGRLFKFSTYNRSHIKKLKVDQNRIIIEVSNKNHRLKIDAERTKGVDLPAPSQGEMTSKVNESLNSKINLKLYDNNKKNKLIFEGTGRNSGLEFVGDIQELIKGIKK
jgi:hypothetical protein